ncbi:unnamed protein product, partial [Musa hybrid cultivar]
WLEARRRSQRGSTRCGRSRRRMSETGSRASWAPYGPSSAAPNSSPTSPSSGPSPSAPTMPSATSVPPAPRSPRTPPASPQSPVAPSSTSASSSSSIPVPRHDPPRVKVVETSALSCGHFGYENATRTLKAFPPKLALFLEFDMIWANRGLWIAAYMPHLSLLYGDLTEEEKERARQRVEALDKEILSLSFEVSALALYKTDTEDKSLESWEQVELCHLSDDK